MDVVGLAEELHGEARATNERRLLVLSGERERGYDALESVLSALPVGIVETTLVGPEDRLRCEHVPQANADRLLGTTRAIVVLDAHADLRPNALGTVAGAVDGGGLLVLLAPDFETWPDRSGGFRESMAAPPFSVADVTGRFVERLVDTLRAHRGIAIVDVDAGRIVDDGLTKPAPRSVRESREASPDSGGRFPAAAYDACLTGDQADALAAFEALSEPGTAVVLEADRGRGKSSAAGLAAGSFALAGEDVLVTAPAFRNAREVFARATALVAELEGEDGPADGTGAADGTVPPDGIDRVIRTAAGGRVRFLDPVAAREGSADADVVIVDEAAALPVSILESLLSAERIAFATTIHGYEGAGRGFSVRFRDRLAASDRDVIESDLVEPVRYAAGDPVEVWAFRALCLDARPPVEQLVEDAAPESVEYRRLDPDALVADENLLREAFGLLVLAHYRTEPNDLARLLDAPNLEARALTDDGRVVSIALLAREGDLPAATRAAMYEGDRIPGNMIPDVLTSQLRDEAAGDLAGLRIVRIATHHAVRSRGLGSHLLERVREEFAGETDRVPGGDRSSGDRKPGDGRERVDWLGTGFGATPGLVRFWTDGGYRTVHVSTTRNDASGEYSAIMLAPTSDAGRALADRHTAWFAERFPAVAADALDDLDPDVARAVLRSVDAAPDLDLAAHEWRVVAGAAYGPGLFDVDPGPFRRLVVRYLVEDPDGVSLSGREERLLVLRALQGRPWSAVADRLAYHSAGQCMRALGDALVPLVDRYGDGTARAVRDRFVRE